MAYDKLVCHIFFIPNLKIDEVFGTSLIVRAVKMITVMTSQLFNQ